MEELQQSGKGVEIHQFYAPGMLHLNCTGTVSWKGGKFQVEAHPSGDSSLGAGVMAAEKSLDRLKGRR